MSSNVQFNSMQNPFQINYLREKAVGLHARIARLQRQVEGQNQSGYTPAYMRSVQHCLRIHTQIREVNSGIHHVEQQQRDIKSDQSLIESNHLVIRKTLEESRQQISTILAVNHMYAAKMKDMPAIQVDRVAIYNSLLQKISEIWKSLLLLIQQRANFTLPF